MKKTTVAYIICTKKKNTPLVMDSRWPIYWLRSVAEKEAEKHPGYWVVRIWINKEPANVQENEKRNLYPNQSAA